MPSKLPLELTKEADADLRSILRHSFEVWGPDQREDYARRIHSAFERICEFPLIGRARFQNSGNIRSYSVGEHLIFYRVDAAKIVVRRILHYRRDDAGLLDDSDP